MKHVLAIDGGGIRGIIPALVLAEVEKRTGKRVAQIFDLIAGTSTGGILALGLSKDDGTGTPAYGAADLVKLYQKRGKEIFARSLWKGVSSVGGVTDERYSEKGLENVLAEYFGSEPLGAALTRVLISSYDIERREPHFFKSWREPWETVEMRHAARATSAAPSYFEPALTPCGAETKVLVDGGVFINNPAVSAYAEAKKVFPAERDFLVVSIGTGQLTRPIHYAEARDWGRAGWMLPILSCVFDGVADAANYQLQQILGDDFIRLQTSLNIASDDLDDATDGNLQNLLSEARKLIRMNKEKLEELCSRIGQGE
jgi:hypothetical protein